jgi:hypothetical protein
MASLSSGIRLSTTVRSYKSCLHQLMDHLPTKLMFHKVCLPHFELHNPEYLGESAVRLSFSTLYMSLQIQISSISKRDSLVLTESPPKLPFEFKYATQSTTNRCPTRLLYHRATRPQTTLPRNQCGVSGYALVPADAQLDRFQYHCPQRDYGKVSH